MDDNRLYHILADASSTIEQQRRQIAALAPKADAYDRIGQVLDLGSRRGEGLTSAVDVNWKIQCAMEEIHAGLVNEKTGAERQRTEKPSAERDTAQEDGPWTTGDTLENAPVGRAGVDMSGLGATLGLIDGEPIADEKKPAPRPGTKYTPDGFA